MANMVLTAESLFARYVLPTFVGSAIAVLVSLVLYGLKPVLVLLVLAGMLVVLPSFFLRDVKLYWLTIFLLSLQFDLKKNLVDGVEVLESLKIDYMQFVFTPEIRLSDCALFVLLVVWLHAMGFERKPLYVPKRAMLALGFLVWATVSVVKAPHPYLSIIELVRQAKFFLVYLYVVNNIESKHVLKLLGIVLIASFVMQATATFARYEFQYFEPFEGLFGVESRFDEKLRDEVLSIDTEVGEGVGFTDAKRSFGTLPSPASTTKFFVMLLPAALMFSLRNPLARRQWPYLVAAAVGLTVFYFSFSRTSMLASLVVLTLFCWYALRRGYVAKHISVYLLGLIIIGGIFVAPKLWEFMNNRNDAVTVRFIQYEVTAKMILSNPILGVGINNSTGIKKELTEDSSFVRDPLRRSGEQPIHSFYLSLMAETGLVGFGLYMAFFLLTYKDALQLSRSGSPESRFFSTVVLLGLSGLAIAVLTDPLWDDPVQTLAWFYAGTVVALQRMDASHGTEPLMT